MYVKALMKSIGVKSHLCWRNHLYWKNSQLCSVKTILRNPELSQFSRSVMSYSWDPMDCNMPGFLVHHQLPEPTRTHVNHVGDAIQPSCPRLPLLLPPSIFPSIRVFSNVSVLPIRWPKYWSFSFSISPFNEYSGLIFFRMDWLKLQVVINLQCEIAAF